MIPRVLFTAVIKYGKQPFTIVEVSAHTKEEAEAFVKEKINFEIKEKNVSRTREPS